jgi:hypothetical protein
MTFPMGEAQRYVTRVIVKLHVTGVAWNANSGTEVLVYAEIRFSQKVLIRLFTLLLFDVILAQDLRKTRTTFENNGASSNSQNSLVESSPKPVLTS